MEAISEAIESLRTTSPTPKQEQLARDGYVVRESACSTARGRRDDDVSENWSADSSPAARDAAYRRQLHVRGRCALARMLKWEGDTDAVHGIEPFAHLSPGLEDWASTRASSSPSALVGDERPGAVHREAQPEAPQIGGPNPPHQDYPYWKARRRTPRASRRQPSTSTTPPWRTVPRGGPGKPPAGGHPTRTDATPSANNEMDPEANADMERCRSRSTPGRSCSSARSSPTDCPEPHGQAPTGPPLQLPAAAVPTHGRGAARRCSRRP